MQLDLTVLGMIRINLTLVLPSTPIIDSCFAECERPKMCIICTVLSFGISTSSRVDMPSALRRRSYPKIAEA